MIPIYATVIKTNQNTLKSATMNFKFFTLLCAFFASAYSEAEFRTTNSSKITGKAHPAVLAQLRSQLNTFGGKLSRYLCLLYEGSSDDYIGTGYLVTLDTLVTPTYNLATVQRGLYFEPNQKLGMQTHKLGFHKPYAGPLSVARFYPPISEQYAELIERIPIFPKEYLPAKELPYMTIGFTKGTVSFAVKYIGGVQRSLNYWNACLMNLSLESQYYPRLGDVLITNGYLLGMLTGLAKYREQMNVQYYYFSYPPSDHLDASGSASTFT